MSSLLASKYTGKTTVVMKPMIVEVIFQIRVAILDVVSKSLCPDNAEALIGHMECGSQSKTLTRF